MKFTVRRLGTVTGIRFYKASDEHRHARREPVDRQRARCSRPATFTGETASGWQQVDASPTPVPISANTTYVASYFAPSGHYSARTSAYIYARPRRGPDASGIVDSGRRCTRYANTGAHGGNGVYAYGATSTFPTSTYNGENYWVDVVVHAVRAADGARRRRRVSPRRPGMPCRDRELDRAAERRSPITSYTVTPYIGRRRADAATTVTGNPPATTTKVTRPDQRHDVHVHRRGATNAVGTGHAPRRVERGDTVRCPRRPRHRPVSPASAGNGIGRGRWTGAVERRLDDHLLHRDARTSARPRKRR